MYELGVGGVWLCIIVGDSDVTASLTSLSIFFPNNHTVSLQIGCFFNFYVPYVPFVAISMSPMYVPFFFVI